MIYGADYFVSLHPVSKTLELKVACTFFLTSLHNNNENLSNKNTLTNAKSLSQWWTTPDFPVIYNMMQTWNSDKDQINK